MLRLDPNFNILWLNIFLINLLLNHKQQFLANNGKFGTELKKHFYRKIYRMYGNLKTLFVYRTLKVTL